MLSKASEYAIRALVYIMVQNKKGMRPGYKEIAKAIDSPEQYTAKILQTLTRKGVLNSMKGRGGGFFFHDLSKPVSLYKIITVTESPDYFSKCGFGLKNCNASHPCPMHEEYAIVRDIYYQLTNKTSLQSLADKILDKKAVLSRILITD